MGARQLIIVSYLIIISFIVKGQTGSIKGTVHTSDGKPAESLNIVLENSGRGTIVNQAGVFSFNNVPTGSYTLTASFIGLITQKKEVTVIAGKTVLVDLILAENKAQLQEVVVRAYPNRITNKESEMIARMPIRNLENPQVYNIVGKELLKDQVVTNMTDALKSAPGIAPLSYPSGGIAVISRGFSTSIGARNGLQSDLGRSSADVSNIERIEFIKGPSGTLFGANISSFGGVVNLVTKRPDENFFGNVGLTVGSFQLSRLTADINTPLNEEKTVLLRINTALHRQNSFSEFGFSNNFAFAPSLLYKVNDKLTVLLDAEIYNANGTRPTYTIINPGTGYKSFKDIPLKYRQSLYNDDLDSKTYTQKYFVDIKYKINSHWTSSTDLAYMNEQTNYSYQTYNTWIAKDSVSRWAGIWGPITNTYFNAQQNITGKFTTGALKHTLLAGVSYTNYYSKGMGKYSPDFDTVDVRQSYEQITRAYADKILLQPENVSSRGVTKNEYMGAYVSEVLNVGDRLYTMLSLRFDRYTQANGGFFGDKYKQNALSPKLGVVYQVVKNKVSLFANYINGFQNSQPIEQPDGSILNIKPIYANQWEAGVKSELLNGRINTTVSYYTINIDNALRTDNNHFTRQDGKQQSRGVELDFLANPVRNLNIMLGYGYNENKIIRASENEGNTVAGAPHHIASYWISYKLSTGALKYFGAGVGGNYVSKNYFDDANTITIPGYHVINASLFHETAKWRLGFKLNNIGNKEYWDAYGIYYPTRNFTADIAIKF